MENLQILTYLNWAVIAAWALLLIFAFNLVFKLKRAQAGFAWFFIGLASLFFLVAQINQYFGFEMSSLPFIEFAGVISFLLGVLIMNIIMGRVIPSKKKYSMYQKIVKGKSDE